MATIKKAIGMETSWLISSAQATPAKDITPPSERLIPPVIMIAVIMTAGMAV